MAQRPFTLADASTPPSVWADAQATSSIGYDATSMRMSALASAGSKGGQWLPASADTAPRYDPLGFNGELPAAMFSSARNDRLIAAVTGENEPATVVYVWQTGPSQYDFETVVDNDNSNSNPRSILFGAYFGNGPSLRGGGADVLIGQAPTPNVCHVLVVSYNGSASRYYYNGYDSGQIDAGTALSRVGSTLGGIVGDNATSFNGALAEFAHLPGVYTGDMWDRITQGTMWKWQRQNQIAAGATYKDKAPSVDDGGTVSPISAAASGALGSIGSAASAALLIAGAASVALGGIGVTARASTQIRAVASASLSKVSAAGAGTVSIKASSAASLQPVTAQASARLPVAGIALGQLGGVGAAGTGTIAIRGVASPALAPIVTTSAAQLGIHATTAATLDSISVDARAGGVVSYSGTVAATLGSLTAAGAGSVRITAGASSTLGPVQAAGAGAALIAATLTNQLGSISADAAGVMPIRAASFRGLGPVITAAAGNLSIRGAASIALDDVTGDAQATSPQSLSGAVSATMGPITVTSDARLAIRATASVALDPIAFVASALSDGEPVITPPERIVRAPAQLRLVRAVARPRIVFARG